MSSALPGVPVDHLFAYTAFHVANLDFLQYGSLRFLDILTRWLAFPRRSILRGPGENFKACYDSVLEITHHFWCILLVKNKS